MIASYSYYVNKIEIYVDIPSHILAQGVDSNKADYSLVEDTSSSLGLPLDQ